MAIVALTSSRRWMRGALGNLNRTRAILVVLIVVGAAIAVGARMRIDALLSVDEGAQLVFAVDEIAGDCGTPSVYVIPEPAGRGSRYRLLVDFLGGPNRFPMLGGGDTVAVLKLPEARPPGVGLGRGLPDTCDQVSLTVSGQFARHRFETGFPGLRPISGRNAPFMSMREGEGGDLKLTYSKPEYPTANAALVAVTLEGVEDRFQEGSRRVALINAGPRDLNVFVHEEPGLQFVNAQDNLVRPIGVSRAFVDVHLAASSGANSAVVYRRSPTADIELQHDLVGISTIFGIGVSLLVEGVIILLISLAAAGGRPENLLVGADTSPRQNNQKEVGNSHEQV